MPAFKVGDVVKLKSGGPNMTVSSYGTDFSDRPTKNVDCKWFAGAKAQSAAFHEDLLDTVTPPEPKKATKK